MTHHCNCQAFIILVLFTLCFYHFLFSRYPGLSKRHFSSDILVPFPDSSDFCSCVYVFGNNSQGTICQIIQVLVTTKKHKIIDICSMVEFLDSPQKLMPLSTGRVAQWVKALELESEGSRFKPHQMLDWAQGPNLITRLPMTFRSNQQKTQ